MKTNRFVALLMALVLVLGLASMARADEKPATWLSDELVEIRVMRGENALQPILQDNIKLKTIEELLNVRLIVEVAPDANYDDKKSTLIATKCPTSSRSSTRRPRRPMRPMQRR